jgi:hypothetical protein
MIHVDTQVTSWRYWHIMDTTVRFTNELNSENHIKSTVRANNRHGTKLIRRWLLPHT